MIGMVFGSVGTPLAPWQAAQVCALASISSAALEGAAIAAKIPTAPHRVKIKRLITADTSLTYDFYRWLQYIEAAILSARRGARPARLRRITAPADTRPAPRRMPRTMCD